MTVNCAINKSATKRIKTKRQRGVILTPSGCRRFQSAIQELESSEANGSRLTIEKLSKRINVSTKTLSRLWSSSLGVDRKTLKLCFSALNLELCSSDYTLLDQQVNQQAKSALDNETGFSSLDATASSAQEQPKLNALNLPYPNGPIGLDSPFYIERPPLETLAYQEVTQPGSIIRIQAPRGMGKSSLVLRLLAFAKEQNYRVANIDCRQFDSCCLADLNSFLRCFCLSVTKELGTKPQIDQYWDEELGGKLSCSFYFKTYLLKQIERPVVLVLNNVEHLFEYAHVAEQFFPLLRFWYEEARQSAILQKLRLVIAYSTEEYAALDVNHFLFNIGLPLRLPELTQSQVYDLQARYGLGWSMSKVNQLMALLGGHPLMTQMAFYHICSEGISLEQLLQQATDRGGIFQAHLWQLWMALHKNLDLFDALASVVNTESDISINPIHAYQLESQGLIRCEGDRVKFRCELYRAYFKQQFQVSQMDTCIR